MNVDLSGTHMWLVPFVLLSILRGFDPLSCALLSQGDYSCVFWQWEYLCYISGSKTQCFVTVRLILHIF